MYNTKLETFERDFCKRKYVDLPGYLFATSIEKMDTLWMTTILRKSVFRKIRSTQIKYGLERIF